MYSARVLALLALLVELVNSFSWDIVVGHDTQLEFYNKGSLTHTEEIPSAGDIHSVTYDPVHYRVLYGDFKMWDQSISSFDITTRKIQPVVKCDSDGNYVRLAYDPVTQLLFWKQGYRMYRFSLNPTTSNKTDEATHLFTLDHYCVDVAVDSCGGYIYWITYYKIERARFDGSEREVVIASTTYDDQQSLAIDQLTQKIYWLQTKYVRGDNQLFIQSADLNGKNLTTVHEIIVKKRIEGYSLTVAKDFIYWKVKNQVGIWQTPKIPSQHEEAKLFSNSSSKCEKCHSIAANYKIQELTQGTNTCEAFKSLIPNDTKPKSTVSGCHNYCFKGDCSVSAEGQPTCSCKDGYSGERCEVNACHKHCLNNGVCSLNEKDAPVCQCTAGYDGERCDISICQNYCLQGNCRVGTEGNPKCSCEAGYSGDRCDVPAFLVKCIQTVSLLNDMLSTDVTPLTLGNEVNSTCA